MYVQASGSELICFDAVKVYRKLLSVLRYRQSKCVCSPENLVCPRMSRNSPMFVTAKASPTHDRVHISRLRRSSKMSRVQAPCSAQDVQLNPTMSKHPKSRDLRPSQATDYAMSCALRENGFLVNFVGYLRTFRRGTYSESTVETPRQKHPSRHGLCTQAFSLL